MGAACPAAPSPSSSSCCSTPMSSSTSSSSLGDSAQSLHDQLPQPQPATPPRPCAPARRPLFGTWRSSRSPGSHPAASSPQQAAKGQQHHPTTQQQEGGAGAWSPSPSLPLTPYFSPAGGPCSFPLPSDSLDAFDSSSGDELPITPSILVPVSRYTQTSPAPSPEPSVAAPSSPAGSAAGTGRAFVSFKARPAVAALAAEPAPSPSKLPAAAGGGVGGADTAAAAAASSSAAVGPSSLPAAATAEADAAQPAASSIQQQQKQSGWYYCTSAASAVASLYDDVAGLLASVPRTARTLNWAVRAGLSYKRYLTLADPYDPVEFNQGLSQLHDYWGQRLTAVCRANGGVYVKAGQFLAGFGAIPMEYRKHLALLQDKARPRPFSAVDRVIRAELGASAERVFAEFHPEATAAASLAQVHKARLASGEDVAVKIQYPGLERAANADLTTLSALSAAAAIAFPEFTLTWLYEELRFKLEEELDFRVELGNSARLRSLLSPDRAVTVPALYRGLCSAKLITMEWVQGMKVNDTSALRAARISPRAVGLELEKAFAEMTFLHGYIHADPHPGNIMVRSKGRRSLLHWIIKGSLQPFEIVLLDHGTYLDLPEAVRVQYAQLWCALVKGDRATAASVAMQLGGQRAGQILPVVLTQKARTKEEQAEMQRAAGVSSMGDITNVLSTAPRNVVELLRIASVIRSVTATLGTSLGDRARICGGLALRGVPRPSGSPADGSDVDQTFAQWGYRMSIRSRIMVLQGYVMVNAALLRLLLATLQVFGQDVVLM